MSLQHNSTLIIDNIMGFTLKKHIFKQIISMSFILVLVLCLVFLLIQSLRLLDLVINRGVDIPTLMTLVLLTLPNFFTFSAPLAIFISILYCYRRLIGDQELIIMQAAGHAPKKIMQPAFYSAIVICLLIYLCSLLINPAANREYRTHLLLARSQLVTNLLKPGRFTDIRDNLTIYIRERIGDVGLRGIFIQDRRNNENPITIIAEEGSIEEVDGDFRFIVKNGSQHTNKDGQFHFLKFEHYTISIEKTQESLEDYFFEPSERSTYELLFPAQNELSLRQDPNVWKEINKRFSQPLFAFLAAMIAILAMSKTSFQRVHLSNKYLYFGILGLILSQSLAMLLLNLIVKYQYIVYLLYPLPILSILLCYFFITVNNSKKIKKKV